jgi:hypothetical protein
MRYRTDSMIKIPTLRELPCIIIETNLIYKLIQFSFHIRPKVFTFMWLLCILKSLVIRANLLRNFLIYIWLSNLWLHFKFKIVNISSLPFQNIVKSLNWILWVFGYCRNNNSSNISFINFLSIRLNNLTLTLKQFLLFFRNYCIHCFSCF